MSTMHLAQRAARPVGRHWRCAKCLTLLGTYDESSMKLKYKQVAYEVRGSGLVIVAICRKCGMENRLSWQDQSR